MKQQVIREIKKFFSIEELVCPHTYKAFGDKSWQFLDELLLVNLLILRKTVLKIPLIINDYKWGGSVTQRGFRCNICQIPKDKTIKNQIYLSAHCNGAGVDIVSKEMTAQQMRDKIKVNIDLFNVPIRVEKDVTWLHFDVYDNDSGNKYTEF